MILKNLACPQNIVSTVHSTKPCVKEIKMNDQLINDQNIAQKFNEYFVSIRPNIAEKIDLVKDAQAMLLVTFLGTIKN